MRRSPSDSPSRRPRGSRVLSLVTVLAFLGAAPASAGIESVAVWAGAFDLLDSDSSGELGAELAFDAFAEGERPVRWTLRPAVGAMGTGDDAVYVHAGFRLDFPIGRRWTVTFQEAAGWYERGDDKELGGELQFRSGLEAAVDLTRRQRLGILLYHLSNAGIEDTNPGAESLVLTWRWRL